MKVETMGVMIDMAPAALVAQATATARAWIERGCPPESKDHVLAALDRIDAEAAGFAAAFQQEFTAA